MKNSIALLFSKESELVMLEHSIVKETPAEDEKTGEEKKPEKKIPKKVRLTIQKKTTVGEFKKNIQQQIQMIAGMDDSDEIEIEY